MECPKCHSNLADDAKFCGVCGSSMNNIDNLTVNQSGGQQKKKKKFKVKIILCIFIVLLLIIAAVFIVSKIFTKEQVKYISYLKDSTLYSLDIKADSQDKMMITRFNEDMNKITRIMQGNTYSEDGKYLYYSQSNGGNGSGASLYCKDLSKEGQEYKIDDNIIWYNTSRGKIAYTKDGAGLYFSDMKNTDKLADFSTASFKLQGFTQDGKQFVWFYDGTIYYAKSKNITDKKVLDKGVSDVIAYFAKSDEIYYLKDNALFYSDCLSEPKKIISNCNFNDFAYSYTWDNGFYYKEAAKGSSLSYMDMIEDDYIGLDQSITESDTVSLQNEKLQREQLREELKNKPFTDNFTLYFIEKGEQNKVAENVADLNYVIDWYPTARFTNENPLIYYQRSGDVQKPKLSELKEYDTFYTESVISKINEAYKQYDKVFLANKTKYEEISKNLTPTYASSCMDNPDSDSLYYIDENELFEISYKKSDFGSVKSIDTNVSFAYPAEGEGICSLKNGKDDAYELYYNGKWLSDNANMASVDCPGGAKEFAYFKNFSEDLSTATLMIYDGKESKKLMDEVSDYKKIRDGEYLVITNFDEYTESGDLKYIHNGKIEDIEQGVSLIGTFFVPGEKNHNKIK